VENSLDRRAVFSGFFSLNVILSSKEVDSVEGCAMGKSEGEGAAKRVWEADCVGV